MNPVLYGVAKMAVTFVDVVNTANTIEQLRQNNIPEEERMLYTASLVNKLILLGFNCAEAGALAQEASNDILYNLKKIELMPRSLEVAFKFLTESAVYDGSFEGNLKWFERAIIAPIADLIRVASAANVYCEKYFLAMAPEERAATQRPIYKYNLITKEMEIVGCKPVDVEECKDNLANFQSQEGICSMIRILSEMTIPSTVISGGSLYENLLKFLHLTSDQVGQIRGTLQEFSLLALEEIPPPLHADSVFRRYICPITHQPIRFPVGDPNGNTVYERSAILNWLQVRRVSPITRRPLFPHQLIPKPGLQALIDHRLGFHERRLWNYLQQSPLLQANLNVPADPALQQQANRENPNI